jgi:hypothetical protein
MKSLLMPLPFLLLMACGNASPPMEETHSQAMATRADTAHQQEAPPSPNPVVSSPDKAAEPKMQQPPAAKSSPDPAPAPKPPKAGINDTLRHFYSDGRLSVILTPWMDRKREIWVFDPWGARTYTMEETSREYSKRADLSFGSKGNLREAVIHFNPGASRYTYTTTITFSQQNMPEWKTEEQFPMESLELPDKSYWDSKAQRWVKQEIVKEQPVPEQFRR